MTNKTITLCLTGAITTNEFFAITLITTNLDDAKNWARNCADYSTSSILQYIGNWQADDAAELTEDLAEDLLDPLYRRIKS